jgi:cytochrome c553
MRGWCTVIVTASLLSLAPADLGTAAEAPAGATSCSGCHPAGRPVDTPVSRLAGRAAADIVTAMRAFRSGELRGTVMDRIAKGFSDDEIRAIADWYAAQQ